MEACRSVAEAVVSESLSGVGKVGEEGGESN